jgi:SagB-type dehydrogenase family enzyme
MGRTPGRLRRAASIVSYWRDHNFVFENYQSRVLISADPIVASVLDCFREWQTPAQACSRLSEFTSTSVKSAVRQLSRLGFLIREGSWQAQEDTNLQKAWAPWWPAAALLHFSSKNLGWIPDLRKSRLMLQAHAQSQPAPPAVKRYPKAPRLELPAPNIQGEFPEVLLARRTWREFSQRPLELSELSTLLWLTCGIQHWVQLPNPIGRVALKTSPSGGARHPLEAYVAVRRVRGVAPGLYHYSPDGHRLELLRKGCTAQLCSSYLAGQWWFGAAGAIMFMTAVFKRNQWKYPDAAAYRTVILDAGHLCQTFCLTATWLGLAPFCTMAMKDSTVERDLGVDGITESLVYAAGVGTKPQKEWAPWPEPGVKLTKSPNFPRTLTGRM